MKKPKKITLICLLLVGLNPAMYGQTPAGSEKNQGALQMDSILKQGPEYNIIKPLAGNWKVIQTIYAKEDGKILSRDTFKAERKMIGNFLQEVMQPVAETKTNAFTRISYLNYNRANLRWEYIVLDTRYPVMMFETSTDHRIKEDNSIDLYLNAFIVPPFLGQTYAGLLGKEHRVVTFKGNDSYIHRQYWTLPAGKEFLAIEYVFTRQ